MVDLKMNNCVFCFSLTVDFHGLSDEEGSSEVFLTTDSDYDSSRAQSPRELDLLPPSPLSSSGGGVGGGGGGGSGTGALRDSTPDVLQASEPQTGPTGEQRLSGGGPGGERRRGRGGPMELFDSDFILPSRQIELLRITEKRQAFCVRTSSLDFSSPSGGHPAHSPSPSPSSSLHPLLAPTLLCGLLLPY